MASGDFWFRQLGDLEDLRAADRGHEHCTHALPPAE
jgi:hypothetical protein